MLDSVSVAEVVRVMLEKNELELSGIDAGVLGFGSEAEALEAVTHIGQCAVLARRLDGPRVIFRAGEGRIEYIAGAIEKLMDAMQGHSFDLCTANAAGGLLDTPGAFAELAGRLVVGTCGLALDPGAAAMAGWKPEEFARAATKELRYVYFTDVLNGRPALPGSGEVDWERLAGALRVEGYSGYLSVAQPEVDPLTAESDTKETRGYAEALIHSAE